MGSSDFLRKHAETPLCEHYNAAGAVCSLATNCEQLLESARGSFIPLTSPSESVDFSLRFWVDEAYQEHPPWPQPYVRGLDHLVFAGFDSGSSMLCDLRTRRVIGRFSGSMASDQAHWRSVIFPILMSIIAGTVGIVELHASCVAKDERGLILVGPSRSGKSTLAMALTKAGFRLLSDDRTFCAINEAKLLAYGLPRPLKLRGEAGHWFEELRDREPVDVQRGELVYFCEPNESGKLGRNQVGRSACEPHALVLLDRQEDSCFSMCPMAQSEVLSLLQQDLLAESQTAIGKQEPVLECLTALPCWKLQYGGPPKAVAEQMVDHLTKSGMARV